VRWTERPGTCPCIGAHLDGIQQVGGAVVTDRVEGPHRARHSQALAAAAQHAVEHEAQAEGELVQGVGAGGEHKALVPPQRRQ
jgi:hypothetical protein